MIEPRVVPTAELDATELTACRSLLDKVFADLTEHDWEHCLGGLHAMVWDGPHLVGHAALVERRLLHSGRALRTGYVEGVAVRTDRRGQGHGSAMMAAVERAIRRAYDLGALGATDDGAALYARRGWRPWRGPTSTLTPTGVRRTPDDDGCVFVLPVTVPLDVAGELICDWRGGDAW